MRQVLLAFLCLAFAAGISAPSHGARAAAITYIPAATAGFDDNNTSSTISVAYAQANGAGHLLVAAVTWQQSTGINSVTDSAGNTWMSATSIFDGVNYEGVAIYYAENSKAGPNTVRVNFNDSNAYRKLVVTEFSGIALSSSLDKKSTKNQTANNSTDAVTTDPVTPSQNGELFFGAMMEVSANHISVTSGTDFSLAMRTAGPYHLNTEYYIQPNAASHTATWTWDASDIYAAAVATFKAVPSGAQVSSRSDALSNSQPSATSNHTITFTTQSSLDTSGGASSTLTLTLPSKFDLSSIYCKDVDLTIGGTATSIAGYFSGRATSKNCPGSATSWGLFIDPTATTITFYTPTSARTWVAAGTQVTIKIGSNATFQDAGTAWITNPSTPGVYTISVGGTFGGSGNIPVSINAGVTVQATMAENLSFTVRPIVTASVSHQKSDAGYCFSSGPGGNVLSACAAGASNVSFTFTPMAASDGVLVAVGCGGVGTPSAVSLSASNWSFTQVGSIIGSSQNWVALFKAYSPGTSQATITENWTGVACNGFMNNLIDEWTGVDQTNFVDASNSGTGSGSCSVNVTPNANNDGLNGFCQDSVTAVGGGFSEGGDDAQNDWSEYKVLSGGAGVPQTVNFTGSGVWEEFAVAIKPAICTADDGATVNAISTTATSVPFGFISPNTFYQGCQDLTVSTNALGGYSLTVQEKYAMRTANGLYTIPDTTCDAANFCSVATATTWMTPTNYGLGHTCWNVSGSDCNASFLNGMKFKPLPNVAAGTVSGSLVHQKSGAGECSGGGYSGNFTGPACTGTDASRSFTYTPAATSSGILISVSCGAGNTPTNVTLNASGWTFTQVGSIAGSANSWAALFRAFAPNTSQATITETWTVSGGCTGSASFMNDLIDEWSGIDPVTLLSG